MAVSLLLMDGKFTVPAEASMSMYGQTYTLTTLKGDTIWIVKN